MIDTHCHLTFPELHDRLDDVLARALNAGVHQMISIATGPHDIDRVTALADAHEAVFATVGIHPGHAHELDPDDRDLPARLADAADRPKVVAWGELGLDYHYPGHDKARQRRVFELQLGLVAADDHARPCVIHNREATADTLDVLRHSGLDPARFVFHCFTGSGEELHAILDYGARVSFTGIVTFNSARELAQASDAVPDEWLMVETDAPFLTPAPYRSVRPNEPCYVVHVAACMAARRGIDPGDFERMTDRNARAFFNLPEPA